MRATKALALLAACALAPCAATQSEAVATKPPTKRELRLQRAVDAMVELVEKHSGLKFPEPPVVRATRHAEWREIVKRELGLESARDVLGMSIAMLGLYLPASQEVVLSPLVVAPLTRDLEDDAPRRRREAVAHQKATVVHEIVHALQEMHFQLPSKLMAAEEDDEIRRYRYLIEGHAVFVEERVAERELGIESFMVRSSYTGMGGMGGDPSYAVGRNYFVHVFRTEGMRGVLDRLKNPPTLESIVALTKKPMPPEPVTETESGEGAEKGKEPSTDRER